MLSCFHENLAELRRQKKINQRDAAAALGVSQALLSHYEKGLREPGMEFLLRAADYYEVSADWLLGRTTDMNGTAVTAGPFGEEREQPDAFLRRTRRHKTEMLASVGTLYDLLVRMDNHGVEVSADRYLSICLYRLLCLVHLCGGQQGGTLDMFGLPRRYIYDLARTGQEEAALELLRQGRSVEQGRKIERFCVSPENLEQEFGPRGAALAERIKTTGKKLSKRLEE